ncbi:MAG: hypothetical protein FRX49_12265 [Trebouxia sp. A1-2]|nr:MAG: hypothetical protein FRX49_12265 [Trebouxia sp. A1-2]
MTKGNNMKEMRTNGRPRLPATRNLDGRSPKGCAGDDVRPFRSDESPEGLCPLHAAHQADNPDYDHCFSPRLHKVRTRSNRDKTKS